MSDKTIVKNATKYFLAIIVTMYLWQFAGRMVTAKNDIENIIGLYMDEISKKVLDMYSVFPYPLPTPENRKSTELLNLLRIFCLEIGRAHV